MSDCFIFSGQGSHRPGMGLKLYQHSQIAKDKIHLSNQILGYDISDIMFDDNEDGISKLYRTLNEKFNLINK